MDVRFLTFTAKVDKDLALLTKLGGLFTLFSDLIGEESVIISLMSFT
jgi:hypothetical protein